jgi:sortase A
MSILSGVSRVVERTLLAAGAALLGWTAVVLLDAAALQRRGERQLDEMLARATASAPERAKIRAVGVSTFEVRRPAQGELIGRLELPRLGLRAVVHEGVDDRTLLRAVGHIPGTAFPGTRGTVGLAAHRDSYFRPLKGVRVGDELFVTTPHGRIRYVVGDTRIVEPEETWVLDPTAHESVTLVTCYPFSYIGLAPQRFIVRARREDLPPRALAGGVERSTSSSHHPVSRVTAAAAPAAGSLGSAKKPGKPSPRRMKRASPPKPTTDGAAPGQGGTKRGFWRKLLSVVT